MCAGSDTVGTMETDALSQVVTTGWIRYLPIYAVQLLGVVVHWQRLSLPGRPAFAEDDPYAEVLKRHVDGIEQHLWERLCGGVGSEVPTTADNALDVLIAAGLVEIVDGGFWRMPLSLPLPEAVLEMSSKERADEDRLRWDTVHFATSQKIVDVLLDLHGFEDRVISIRTCADATGIDGMDIRAGFPRRDSEGWVPSAGVDVDSLADDDPLPIEFIMYTDFLYDLLPFSISIAELAAREGLPPNSVRRALERIAEDERRRELRITPDPRTVDDHAPLHL